MGEIFVDGSSSVVVRGSFSADASVQECAAWEMIKMSREQVRHDAASKCSVVSISDHNIVFHVVKPVPIPGFRAREFLLERVWKRQGDKVALVVDGTEHAEFPPSSLYVQGKSAVYVEYKELPSTGIVAHTLVTFTQQIDLGGLIPKSAVNRGAVNRLMYLSTMRKRFDMSLEVDGATRRRNVEMIQEHDDEYSAEETKLLEDGEQHFADFKGMKVKSLKMWSPLTTAEIAFKKKDSHAWGRATTTVRTSPEEVLAFAWDTMRRSSRQEDDLEKSVEERINGHNQLGYTKRLTPKIIYDRDFLGRGVWKKGGEGFVYVTSPEESEARPITGSVVRGQYPSAMKIKRKNDTETTLEYVILPDAGGHLQGSLMNRYLGSNLSYVTEIQEYFQALRRLEEWDADDARAVGEVMCIKTTAEKHPEKGESKQSARIRELFKNHSSLREIGRRYVRERSALMHHHRGDAIYFCRACPVPLIYRITLASLAGTNSLSP